MSARTHLRRVTRVGLAVLAVWCAFALVGLLHENPFRVATEAAAAAGGWSPEQVRFERGSYSFRGLYSVTTARLAVATEDGEIPVAVELLHVPLRGWSMRRFEADAE